MSLSTSSRIKFGGALVGAFLGGLIIASGFNLTPFGYAQVRPVSRTVSTTSAPPVSGAVADLSLAFTSIAEKVTPAVVSIDAERTQTRTQNPHARQRGQVPPGLDEFFNQMPQFQEPRAASGSGFIVSKDGYILTNNHVVADFDRVYVTLTDNRKFDAKVVGRDPTTDVAVIKIDANNLPVASLGDDDASKIGEWVLAIGNPLGLKSTVTAGIISAKGRGGVEMNPTANKYAITDFIQTDAAINPGNSGGPLVNIQGQVIGINSMIASQTGYYSGYGFAIPITLAKEVMDDIVAHGRVRRAMLGVSIDEANQDQAAAAGLKEIRGVVVEDFTGEDSPAKAAGMEPGDVIIRADGKDVDHVSSLQRVVRSHEPGETINLDAMRFGQQRTFHVKLAEARDSVARVASNTPEDSRSERGTVSGKLGVTVQPVTADEARANDIPESRRGLRVVDVNDVGPAHGKFADGDILVSLLSPSKVALHSVNDLQQAVSTARSGQYLTFLVYNVQAQGTRVVTVRIGE